MAFSSNDPRNYVAVGRQADFDTAADSFKFVKYLGDSGVNIEQDAESIFEGGDGQDQGYHYRSRVRADGQITANVRPDVWTWAAAWSMGSAAAVGTSAGVGTSIYVPNATLPDLTIENAFAGGNQIERAHAAKFTGWQLEGEAGGLWQLTLPFMSAGTPVWRDGQASALSPVLESGDPAQFAGGAYLINGGSTLDMRRFAINFERQVDADIYTNSVFRRKIVLLTRSIEVTGQVVFQNADLWRSIKYGAANASVIGENLATGAFHVERKLAGSQLMAADVPLVRWTGADLNSLEPDGETLVVDFTGMAAKGATGIMQLRSVHNAVGASAYL